MERTYENFDYIEQSPDPEAWKMVERLGGIAAGEGDNEVSTASQAPNAPDGSIEAHKEVAMSMPDTRPAIEVFELEPDLGGSYPRGVLIPDLVDKDKTYWINLDEEDPQEPEAELDR
jgi:hypothetical protein